MRVCRLAMQLLAARRSEVETARREERSAPTAQAIAGHRLALLAEASASISFWQGYLDVFPPVLALTYAFM